MLNRIYRTAAMLMFCLCLSPGAALAQQLLAPPAPVDGAMNPQKARKKIPDALNRGSETDQSPREIILQYPDASQLVFEEVDEDEPSSIADHQAAETNGPKKARKGRPMAGELKHVTEENQLPNDEEDAPLEAIEPPAAEDVEQVGPPKKANGKLPDGMRPKKKDPVQ